MANYADHAQAGFDEITGSTNGDWVGFLVVGGSATVSATTSVGDNLSSATFAEGVYIAGPFTQIVPTAGTVLATRRRSA